MVLFVRPLRENSFVEIQENGIERLHLSIKDALHVSVCTKRLFDVTDSTALGSKFAGLEVVDVVVVVKHKSHSRRTSIDLERMSAKYDSLEYDTVGCTRQKISISDESH